MSSGGGMIILINSQGDAFEVDVAVAKKLQIIKHMVEDNCANKPILLPNVSGKVLSMVILYCKNHVDATEAAMRSPSLFADIQDKLKMWEADFVNVDIYTLFDLILAAKHLDVKSLLDLTCATVIDMIKGKSHEEAYKMFNIKNDFDSARGRKG